MTIFILKKIFLIFHKLITFYEYLMILIHQDYNFRKNEISINFLDF